MGFLKFVVKRLFLAVPILIVLSLIIFSTMMLVPINERARLYMSEWSYVHPGREGYDEIVSKYHLNDTFIVQWITWMGEVLKGNLGYSMSTQNTVLNTIQRGLPATLEIIMFAAPLSVLGGYKIGAILAKRSWKKIPKGDLVDNVGRIASTIGYATPSFILGLVLLLIFYVGLHWPSIGRLSIDAAKYVSSMEFTSYTGLNTIDALLNLEVWIFVDALKHLVLPVATLVTALLPIVVRITRTSMMGEFFRPYFMASRSKGLSEKEVFDRTRKSSMFPVLTISGTLVASMLVGAVVVETLFQIPGLGFFLVEAADYGYDSPLLVAICLTLCTVFIISNLIVDVVYSYLDPRVKI